MTLIEALIIAATSVHGLRLIRWAVWEWAAREEEKLAEFQSQAMLDHAVSIPHATATVYQVDAAKIRYHQVMSAPHLTATTPKVTYQFSGSCRDCTFEMLTLFGGEVAVPVRTAVCPAHQRAERLGAR